jgi:hypothetical protein
MSSPQLILPGSLEFNKTLGSIPFWWRQIAERENGFHFAADAESGLLRVVDGKEMAEYLYGGEYYERLEAMGYEDEDEFSDLNLNGVEEIYIDL